MDDLLRHEFVTRALLGALLIGLTNGFLGAWVLLRRMALTTEALSHAMFPGLALALILFGMCPTALVFGGLCSAGIVAGCAEMISRSTRLKQDAAMGILYAIAYALGVTLISLYQVPLDLEHWLFGNPFALSSGDLYFSYGVALVIIPLLIALERPLMLTVFDEDVARTLRVPVRAMHFLIVACLVVSAVGAFQAAGVVPVVALLVAPAATMRLITNNVTLMIYGSAALGALGAVLGILLTFLCDGNSGGAFMALTQGLFFFLALVFAPTHGIFWRMQPAEHFCEESFRRWHRPITTGNPTLERRSDTSSRAAASIPVHHHEG